VAGTQLRRYEINPGEMDRFLVAWRGVVAIRAQHGFRVEFALVDADANEFVWAITHDGDFAAAEADYYASPERATVDPNPADNIAVMHLSMVTKVEP
jgi:GH25 family lysozyme M1 (1,4-beta-N-acetylmuramidase)